MIRFSVKDLNKYYGAQHVLKGLNFEVFEGERVGLLGKNGAGKTTLFKILSGSEAYESGSVYLSDQVKLGVLDQIPVYPQGFKAVEVLMTAFEGQMLLKEEMQGLELAMAAACDDSLIKRYGEIQSRFETQGGYAMDSELSKICNGLEISEEMQRQAFELLSGGEKTRVNLGRILLQNPQLLLLDEPTNHLDIASAEWMEEFLKQYKGTVIVISHDRYFLDHAVTRIIELVDGKAELYSGNYSYYVQEKEDRYQQQLAQYQQEQRKVKQLEEAARKMHEWANNADNPALHKRAFAMEKRIERLETTERPTKERTMKGSFQKERFAGKEVVVLEELSKAYDGNKILDRLSITLYKGQRIALLGRNGCGKTTLLRLLSGEEQPDSGRAKLGESIRPALLQQNIIFERPERTVLDMVRYDLELSDSAARNLLAAYKFKGNDVFKRVSALSGGEKTRLRLCLLMQKGVNMLILDEPTNHLDIASREWVESCVEEFGGTVLFVSHDRYFINRFAETIWELEEGQLWVFDGSYEEYRRYEKRSKEESLKRKTEDKQNEKKTPPKRDKEELPYKEGQKQQLEKEILELEETLESLTMKMEQSAADYKRLEELLQEKQQLSELLEDLYQRWIE
jgi:ATP-binding cassette subfamily F protein 3